ncbi:MAG: hypothetical protein HZB31_12765 [Nitrospirae bacterium]|nr:hypothetical protein [Nitrospirota bacterium]
MLELFTKFLFEKVHEKNVPYYLKRGSDCYRFFDIPVRAIEEELKK